MTMNKIQIASKVAVVLFMAMAVFQILVAAGVAPVNMLWGGSQSELTLALRCASLLAAGLLMGMAWVIYQRAHYHHQQQHELPAAPSGAIRVLAWIITAYMLLNTFGNLASQNPYERCIFGSLTTVLFVACFIVASSPLNETDASYQEVI